MDRNLKIQLVRSIFQFKRLASSGFGMTLEKNKSDINVTELILMDGISDNAVDSESNISLSDIRRYLSVSKAAVSQMLGALEKKGYINRDIDKNNRRNLVVTLTPEGREVLVSQREIFSGRLEKIISHLGENDVEQMIRIVNRMIEITNELDSQPTEEQEE